MKPITVKEIVLATGGTLLWGNEETVVSSVCTDNRKTTPDSLFIPLIGERFDAHDFIESALSAGASVTLTASADKVNPAWGKAAILVEDTRRALGALSAYYRQKFSLPLVAITGSVGKTTVKELTYAALSTEKNTLKTDGNFNNEIGLPLTLFRLEDSHEAAIIEMGMSGFGEIDALASMATPDIGILTNIGMSHIEKLGSQENIYKAKSELFSHIKEGGIVIINGEDSILAAHKNEIKHQVISCGLTPEHDLFAENMISTPDGVTFTAVWKNEKTTISLGFPGEHNVINALLACAAALCLGIPMETAAKGLSAYVPDNQRMQLIDAGGMTIINDCYNAAPASVAAAIRVLCARSGRKIAVLGDIMELGTFSEEAHRTIGKEAKESGVDAVFAFGENARWIAKSAGDIARHYDDIDKLNADLGAFVKPGDNVLIKGSRAMKLERVTNFLTERK